MLGISLSVISLLVLSASAQTATYGVSPYTTFPNYHFRPYPTLYSQPQTLPVAPTTTAADSPTQFTIPSTFQTSLPTLITSPPTQHLTNILQALFPSIRPVTTSTTAEGGTGATLYFAQPQQTSLDTQGTATGTTATGQQVLYYYYYPQQQQQQLASRSAAYSYSAPTLQQQQPATFSYYIHPATYAQPQV